MKRRNAVGLLVVAGACAVVAMAATGVGLLRPPASLDGGWTLAVRIAGAAAVVAGSAGLLAQRKRLVSHKDRHYDPTAAALGAAAMIMAVLALVARFAPAERFETEPVQADSTAAHGVAAADESPSGTGPPRMSSGGDGGGLGLVPAGPDTRIPQQAEVPSDARFDRSLLRPARGFVLVLILLALAVLGALVLTGRLRRRKEAPLDAHIDAADAEAALEASLDDVAYDGGDPRLRITTAYRRLLAALSAAGAPRRPEEAPYEHLHRVLGPLGVQPGPMHRLTQLYVVAQFSHRRIMTREQAVAGEALEAALVSLRAATGQPARDGARSIPETSPA